MGSGHGTQAGCPHRGGLRRRDADDHPPIPAPDQRGAIVTETPNPNIVDADTLTGEMRPIRRAVVALGSNLGEKLTSLQGAVHTLADTPGVWFPGVSPVYETVPVDAPEGSDTFLNAVVLLDTALAASRL